MPPLSPLSCHTVYPLPRGQRYSKQIQFPLHRGLLKEEWLLPQTISLFPEPGKPKTIWLSLWRLQLGLLSFSFL